jgi:DNA-binding PadR family transcriptional regulator
MGDSIGEFEKLLLLAVLRLGDDAYGAAIIDELAERTRREVSPGAVYVSLRRLQDKGMLRSGVGEPTPARGGRAKRYYRVRRDGVVALKTARQAWDAMVEGLEAELEFEV